MSFYALPPLIVAVLFAAFGLFILVKSPNSPATRSYGTWYIGTFIWQGSWAVLFNVKDPVLANLIVRIGYSSIIFLPPVFYNFLIDLLEVKGWERRFSYSLYGISSIFLIALWSGTSFIDGFYQYSWGYYPKAGFPLHPIYLALTFFIIGRSPWLIYKHIADPATDPVKRNQLKYVILAIPIYSLAAFDFISNYGISFYPLGVIPIIASFGIIGYAIFRHQLLEINIALKRVSLILIIYTVLLLLILPTAIPVSHAVLHGTWRYPSLVFLCCVVAFGLIFSFGPFAYAALVRRSFWLKGNLTTGLTHELKSPLGAIQSAIEILLDESQKTSLDKTKLKDYLEMIQTNATRLEGSVKGLLNVARIQTETIGLNIHEIDFRELIEPLVSTYRQIAQSKGLTFSSTIAHLPLIKGDPEKIQQIISNLLSNAVKFSREGEALALRDLSIGADQGFLK